MISYGLFDLPVSIHLTIICGCLICVISVVFVALDERGWRVMCQINTQCPHPNYAIRIAPKIGNTTRSMLAKDAGSNASISSFFCAFRMAFRGLTP